jgi:hypothetical protein
MTRLSPCTVGTVFIRRWNRRVPSCSSARPSCGRRFSVMSMPPKIFPRASSASRCASGIRPWSRISPSTRKRTASPSSFGSQVDVARTVAAAARRIASKRARHVRTRLRDAGGGVSGGPRCGNWGQSAASADEFRGQENHQLGAGCSGRLAPERPTRPPARCPAPARRASCPPVSSEISPPITAVSPSFSRTMVEACLTSVSGAVCRPSGLVTIACNRVMAGSTSRVMTPLPSICGVTARIVPMVMVETESSPASGSPARWCRPAGTWSIAAAGRTGGPRRP